MARLLGFVICDNDNWVPLRCVEGPRKVQSTVTIALNDSQVTFLNSECRQIAFLPPCGKEMFLHLSVILFTGCSLSRGVSVRGFSVQGGLCLGVSVR